MNSKMTINSQLSTTAPRKQKQKLSKQLVTGTESQKWRSHGSFSVGRGRGRKLGKLQEIRSIIGRYKIDRKMLIKV